VSGIILSISFTKRDVAMKFTTTSNYTYRAGIGNVPKAWIDFGHEDHEDSIWKYFKDNTKCWDWDACFDEEHDFVFQDGKAFRLYYSGWSEWHHEDDEKNGLQDEVTIEEISLDEANVPEKHMERNWL
jgi:hypothetical protein